MCTFLKLHYTKFDVSRLLSSKIIEEKLLGGSARPHSPPPPLGKGRANKELSHALANAGVQRQHIGQYLSCILKSLNSNFACDKQLVHTCHIATGWSSTISADSN